MKLLLSIQLGLTGNIALASAPFVYVSNISGNNVSVVNPTTGAVVASVPVPTGPNGLAVTPDGTAVYVVSQSTNKVAVISTATNSVIATINVAATPVQIAISPNGALAYVVNQGSNNVSVIDTAAKSVTATITVGSHPGGVAFSPDGAVAFVTNILSGTVSIIDTAKGSVTGSFIAGSGPTAVVFSPTGAYAYVANRFSGTVTVHAVPSGSIAATITGFGFPNSVAITPNGKNVFVTNGNSGTVSVINTISNTTVANLNTGALPASVAISEDGSEAYVVNENGFSLSRLSTSSFSLITTIAKVGVYPVAVATAPAPTAIPVVPVVPAGPKVSTPFGSIDTPANHSTGLSGAIGLTGWALSSAGIQTVTVWREPVAGESASGLIPVGTADLVPGSRPDVAQAYPGYPNNNYGWGLQILTNELPKASAMFELGNGSYNLHVLVTDKIGEVTDLGVRTITVDNADSVLPFGTIDTPAQGGVASGNAYVNFGWVLTPQPSLIPLNGSTIWVFIDDKPVGHPSYNSYRPDIAALFPGLTNSNGAVGAFIFDTTKYANGPHTISWTVTDSAGHSTGLGSRYFNILN